MNKRQRKKQQKKIMEYFIIKMVGINAELQYMDTLHKLTKAQDRLLED